VLSSPTISVVVLGVERRSHSLVRRLYLNEHEIVLWRSDAGGSYLECDQLTCHSTPESDHVRGVVAQLIKTAKSDCVQCKDGLQGEVVRYCLIAYDLAHNQKSVVYFVQRPSLDVAVELHSELLTSGDGDGPKGAK